MHLGFVCPAVGYLPVSTWLGGFLPSPLMVGGCCHSASSSPGAVGVCGEGGLAPRSPHSGEEVRWAASLLSLPDSPQGNTAQRGKNCNPAPDRKTQSRDTDAYQLVNPPPASQMAAVRAEMGICPVGCSSTGTDPLLAPFPAAAAVPPVILKLLTWSHALGRV